MQFRSRALHRAALLAHSCFTMAAAAKKKVELASVPNFDAPFLSQKANKENADMNQYWYSESSIQVTQRATYFARTFSRRRPQTIVAEVLAVSTRAAFVSTPSIFFTLPEGAVKSCSKVLDVRASF